MDTYDAASLSDPYSSSDEEEICHNISYSEIILVDFLYRLKRCTVHLVIVWYVIINRHLQMAVVSERSQLRACNQAQRVDILVLLLC
jgi:hypothetical protein